MITHNYFQKIFKASPLSSLILLPDAPLFTIMDVTDAHLEISGKKESELIGKGFFEIFPANPADNDADGFPALYRSLERVISSRKTEKIKMQKYDIRIGEKEEFEMRYWDIENTPVLNEAGEIEYIINTSIDVTAYVLNQKQQQLLLEEFLLTDESFRNLIQNGSDLISIIDLEGNYKYVSPTSFSIVGYSSKDFIRKSPFEFIHPDDKETVFANFSQVGKVKKLHILPFRFLHKDGSWKWLETIVTDMTDVPSVKGIVTNSRDITQRITAEEQLKASEEKYRSLFKYSPIPKWVYDLDTLEFLDVNETAINHYGYTRDEFLNMTIKDIRPQEELPLFLKVTQNVREDQGLIKFGIFTHLKKDKTPIIVEVFGYCFSSSGKNCLMADCFDVTEREDNLQQIKENEAKLLSALNIASLGYWKVDLDTQNLYWSDEVYRIWGVSKSCFEVSYTSLINSIHPDDIEAFYKEQKACFDGEKDHEIDHRIILPDGSVKWVQQKGKLIKNEFGKPIIFQGTVRDITTNKLLELSLEESNQRYDYVLKATFDAIWDWNLVTDRTHWGEGFTTIFGHDLPGLQSNNFWTEHIHPEDHNRVYKAITASIEGKGINWENQYRFKKADGSYAFVSDKALIIRDKAGKAIRMVGAIQDISEKKLLEELLDKANRLAQIGSWEINVLKGTVFWSEITKEIRETPPGFVPELKVGIGNFKEGKDKDTIIQKVKECMEHGTPWEEELQIITEKGNLKWIRTIGKAELLNGKCVKIYGSFQDIDATKKAELEIRKLYQEKNTILESIGDAFFALDKNWMVTYWNKEAEKMLLVSKNDIIGKYLWDVFSDSVNLKSNKKYNEAVDTNKAVLFEDYYTPLNKWFEVSAYPSENGLSVYFKDITERKLSDIELKKLNERLKRKARELAVSNAELEQFAYIASHDLQEPLRMVTSFLNQLQKKYEHLIDETGKQYIYYAVDGATRMRQIILDLLQFSRVGRMDGKLENIDLNDEIRQIISLYKKQIEETGAVINIGHLPVLKSFQSPLRQVFQNLLSNALKYQKKDEQLVINISAIESKTDWTFSVADNGIGIKPEHFQRIFILFQRLHGKNEYSGTGIGLSIVKKIVEALGGEITLESEPGKGTVFLFTIKKNEQKKMVLQTKINSASKNSTN